MRFSCAAIFAAHLVVATALALAPTRAAAQDVTLTSRDGGVEIAGNLLGFDGQFYRVETAYGELTVDGTGVLCEGPGCPDLEAYVAEIAISGASSVGEVLLPSLIEGFALRSGYKIARSDAGAGQVEYLLSDSGSGEAAARFLIHSTNTDEGFADLLANETDIVMSLREVRPDEASRAWEAGMGDLRGPGRARVLALDALVPIVAPGHPLTEVTLTDLAGIFSGRIVNWSDLGGPDAPISTYLRDPAAGLSQAAEDRLLGPIRATLRPDVIRHVSNRALVRAVMTDPFGIALTTAADTGNAKQLALSGECGFSIPATRRNAKTEDYPLTAPVFLYTPVRRLPRVGREFYAYLSTPAAQLVIRRAGFIDQMAEEIPVADQGDRFANAISQAGEETGLEDLQRMVATLSPLRRLTVSFRFEQGSSALDAQSRSNIRLLADALEAGEYDGRRLLFVGFSDGQGPAQSNRQIALRRAESVRRAILSAAETLDPARITLEAEAFGEAMPMACDDSAWGRQVNRRVEVWVR
ncbi:cell envelope biogenesis protein OmpA [Oceanicola sp. 22II-s10i]|uniref:phosphate ABC transporter substrate-binding/OmpA family protein n=1 Tax=Oceanicola sp. 22II-s10i TaxID=1317116 RepID=UPI000B51EF84|nr:phosphate ABC transporter substrate-binding/OmpA family protein [Oceanicola sp. 22II-s10i]OWU86031.1 cell envelope biogenesis protein OmpA [Oceanicola sp. 22II-s10i]